jgi:hypothetical protein
LPDTNNDWLSQFRTREWAVVQQDHILIIFMILALTNDKQFDKMLSILNKTKINKMYQRLYYARPVRENRKKSYKLLLVVMVPAVVLLSYFLAISVSVIKDGKVKAQESAVYIQK